MTSKASSWAVEIPVNYKTTRSWTVGHIYVPNGPVSEISEQKLKTDAIDIAAKKSKLVHQVLEATISTGGDSRRMADIKEVLVTSTGQEGWCGECDKLKIDVANLYKGLEARLAEGEKKRELMEARLAEGEKKRELTVIIGDLVGALYQVLFYTAAKALPEARRMPREVLHEGDMERINVSFFLKHSNKEGGVLRKYLLRALEFKGITLSDYKILVAAKKIRNETFHNSVPNKELVDTLRLSNIRDASFNDAREVLLRHYELLMEEE